MRGPGSPHLPIGVVPIAESGVLRKDTFLLISVSQKACIYFSWGIFIVFLSKYENGS